MTPTLFPLGDVVATPGALTALAAAGQTPLEFLAHHARGDWGSLDAEDRRHNDLALRTGERVLSAYGLASGVTIWIITEADRSATTLLLPQDY